MSVFQYHLSFRRGDGNGAAASEAAAAFVLVLVLAFLEMICRLEAMHCERRRNCRVSGSLELVVR